MTKRRRATQNQPRARSKDWQRVPLPDPINIIPSMITEEEAKYYLYATRWYSGKGEILEIGPWLGSSTWFIVHGLLKNRNFAHKRLNVVDDFIWRSSWMDRNYPNADKPQNHESFEHLFKRYAESIKQHLSVNRARLIVA